MPIYKTTGRAYDICFSITEANTVAFIARIFFYTMGMQDRIWF